MIRLVQDSVWLAVWLVMAVGVSGVGHAQESVPPQTDQAVAESRPVVTNLKGLTVYRDKGYLEFEATIVFEEGEWVELIACSPNTLEYESLLVSKAQPSHVHLGLIMLGLNPGKPMSYTLVEDEYIVQPAYGPVVSISFVVEDEDGEQAVIPANQWIIDTETGKPMPLNRWLFVGSRFSEINGREVYQADLNGTLITLVHFTDEVIVQAQSETTNRGGGPIYNIDPKKVPKPGTEIKVRITKTDEVFMPRGAAPPKSRDPDS